jgi:hypothetical protein
VVFPIARTGSRRLNFGSKTRRDDSTHVIAAGGHDIESHSGPKIDDDRGITIQLRHCGGVREPIGADRSRRRVINTDAEIKLRI